MAAELKPLCEDILTPEEREAERKNLKAMLNASEANDMELYYELAKQARPPAKVLMEAKEDWGADWIRKMGYDTSRADKVYGPGWLDK